MERIIVGVDGSESSRHALEWAAGEARRRGAALVVVHAWSVPAALHQSSFLHPASTLYESLRDESAPRAMVERLLAEAGLDDGDVEVHLVPGHPGAAIIEAAADAGLIVLGSKRRRAMSELVLGSTARYVTRRADAPVVIVPAAAAESVRRAA